MKTHKDLEVWKIGLLLVNEIYLITRGFPKMELFGLTSQIRRAAVSVPVNISEGAARHSTKEFRHFVCLAFGSLAKLETLLIIANNLEYLSLANFQALSSKVRLITSQFSNLIKALDEKIENKKNCQ